MANLSLYCDKVLQRLSLYCLDLMQKQTWLGSLEKPTRKFEALPGALQSHSMQLSQGRRIKVGDFAIGFKSGIVLRCVQSQDALLLMLHLCVPAPYLIYAPFCRAAHWAAKHFCFPVHIAMLNSKISKGFQAFCLPSRRLSERNFSSVGLHHLAGRLREPKP